MKGPRFRTTLSLFVVLAASVIGVASPAHASTTLTVSGAAVCNSGRAVEGVWVTSTGGGAGWAGWTPMPGRPNVAWYSRTLTISTSSTAVSLHIGCGGSTSQWASSSYTPSYTRSSSLVLNMWCNDPTSGTGSSCSGGSRPSGRSTNWFSAGYCTWGAAELWRKATGTYPSWSGNAKDWASNAGALGFRVSTVPLPRSVLVEPAYVGTNSALGHVAWVTRAWVSSGIVYFHVREMNASAGFNAWDDRDVRYDSRFRFIVAPPGSPVTS